MYALGIYLAEGRVRTTDVVRLRRTQHGYRLPDGVCVEGEGCWKSGDPETVALSTSTPEFDEDGLTFWVINKKKSVLEGVEAGVILGEQATRILLRYCFVGSIN